MAWWLQHLLFTDMTVSIFHSHEQARGRGTELWGPVLRAAWSPECLFQNGNRKVVTRPGCKIVELHALNLRRILIQLQGSSMKKEKCSKQNRPGNRSSLLFQCPSSVLCWQNILLCLLQSSFIVEQSTFGTKSNPWITRAFFFGCLIQIFLKPLSHIPRGWILNLIFHWHWYFDVSPYSANRIIFEATILCNSKEYHLYWNLCEWHTIGLCNECARRS